MTDDQDVQARFERENEVATTWFRGLLTAAIHGVDAGHLSRATAVNVLVAVASCVAGELEDGADYLERRARERAEEMRKPPRADA